MPSKVACMRLDPGATMGNESPAEAGRCGHGGLARPAIAAGGPVY